MSYVAVDQSWVDLVREARLERGESVKGLARLSKLDPKTVNRVLRAQKGVRCLATRWHKLLSALGLLDQWERSQLPGQDPRWSPGEALVRRPAFARRTTETVDVFLAAPMESLGQNYESARRKMMDLLRVLRESLGQSVFYAGEDRPGADSFEDEAWALAENCDILERARRFVLIYPGPVPGQAKPIATSALIELGYAIALRLPVLIFFQKSIDTLPFLARLMPEVFESSHLVRYRNSQDIVVTIQSRQRSFFVPWRARTSNNPQR